MKSRIVAAAVALTLCSMPSSAMKLGGNFWVNADFGSDVPFIDLMMMARGWTIAEADDPGGCPSGLGYTNDYPFPCRSVPTTVTVPADSNGYPLQVPFTAGGKQYRVVAVMLAGTNPNFRPTGSYVLQFEGTGEIELAWDFGPTRSYTGTGGVTRHNITITNPTYTPPFHGSMLNIKRSDVSDHVRNIHIVPAANVDNFQKKVFRDAFMEDLEPYGVLRFMDWCGANWSTDVQWSERTTPLDYLQTNGFEKGSNETAYEYMILLCNKLRKDMWVCIPPQASEDYQRTLAELIRDRLDPTLKVYVEWANETWNGMFWSAQYANQRAATLGINGWCYNGYAAIGLFKVFDQAFGSTVGTRVVKVLAGQHENSGVMECVLSTFYNSSFNTTNVRANAIATAAYFSGSPSTSPLQTHKNMAQQRSLDYITYEGGDKTGIYGGYVSALDVLDNYLSLFNQYTTVNMEWGAKKWSGQPISQVTAGPYKALLEYAMRYNGLDTTAAVVKTQAEPWWLENTPVQPRRASATPSVRRTSAALEHGCVVTRVYGYANSAWSVRLLGAQGATIAQVSGTCAELRIPSARLAPGLYVAEVTSPWARERHAVAVR